MTCHYPDLGGASDWLCRVGNLIQPIRSTTQIWVVTRHQYGISALVSQTSFRGETSGSVAKCRLFSQAKHVPESKTCPRIQNTSGMPLDSWMCFWFWGSVLDSGEVFLDSGKCFRATVALKSPTRRFTRWALFAVKCAVVTFSSDCSKFLYCWLWLHHTQTSIVKTFSAWFTKTSWFLMFYIF